MDLKVRKILLRDHRLTGKLLRQIYVTMVLPDEVQQGISRTHDWFATVL